VAGVIVFDASVLIAYLDGTDEHHSAAELLLAHAVDEEFGASPLTLAEVLVVPARDCRLEAVQSALRHLEIDELPFPHGAAARLAQLRAATGLKMPDCCVLLVAEDAGATLASFDERLAQAAKDRNLVVLER